MFPHSFTPPSPFSNNKPSLVYSHKTTPSIHSFIPPAIYSTSFLFEVPFPVKLPLILAFIPLPHFSSPWANSNEKMKMNKGLTVVSVQLALAGPFPCLPSLFFFRQAIALYVFQATALLNYPAGCLISPHLNAHSRCAILFPSAANGPSPFLNIEWIGRNIEGKKQPRRNSKKKRWEDWRF